VQTIFCFPARMHCIEQDALGRHVVPLLPQTVQMWHHHTFRSAAICMQATSQQIHFLNFCSALVLSKQTVADALLFPGTQLDAAMIILWV
jgi:hypothetical protein